MSNLEFSRWFVRVTALGGLALEVMRLLGDPLHIPDTWETHLHQVGIVLFLIAIVGWLEASNAGIERLDKMGTELKATTLQKLEGIGTELQVIEKQYQSLDVIARYGSGAVSLARLLHLDDRDADRFPHCLAGGITLKELLLDTYAAKAEDFHSFIGGQAREVTLTEKSIINIFITRLVRNLPPGSVWMGTSKLQDAIAWNNKYAEPSFSQFTEAAQDRAGNRSLTWLRLFCCEDEERYQNLLRVAADQIRTKLDVRILVHKDLPDDISLIWIPKVKGAKPNLDLNEPIRSILQQDSTFQALCAIRFQIRGYREVYEMKLIPAGSDFDGLCRYFERLWRDGRKVEPAVQESETAATA